MKKLKVKDENTVVLIDIDTGEIEDTFHSEVNYKEDINEFTTSDSNASKSNLRKEE